MGLFQARVSGQLFGENVMNVLHFQKPQSTTADKGVLAISLRDHFYAQMKFLCSNQMQWREIMVIDPSNPDDLPAILPIVINGFNSQPNAVINTVCAVYRIKTGVGGRRGRGRFYISGIDANGIALGRWNAQMLINLNSVANSLKGGYVGNTPTSGFNLGVIRRGAGEADFIEATDLVARDYPGTQVRRNFFRGQ
jgi:hypothetical protein